MENEFPYDYKPDAQRKSCYDCGNMYAVMSWWCRSEEATKARGTHMVTPDLAVHHCPYWIPAKIKSKPLLKRIIDYIKKGQTHE